MAWSFSSMLWQQALCQPGLLGIYLIYRGNFLWIKSASGWMETASARHAWQKPAIFAGGQAGWHGDCQLTIGRVGAIAAGQSSLI
jgi:hypothetical protein